MVTNKVVIGTAPDSWGIWVADDPNRSRPTASWTRSSEAGYEWIEIGAVRLPVRPTPPAARRAQLARGSSLRRAPSSPGCTMARTIDDGLGARRPIAALTAAMGAEHLVVIPDLWRDDMTGEEKESRELTAEQWTRSDRGPQRARPAHARRVRRALPVPLPRRQPRRLPARRRALPRSHRSPSSSTSASTPATSPTTAAIRSS